jgi:hypothetical protein
LPAASRDVISGGLVIRTDQTDAQRIEEHKVSRVRESGPRRDPPGRSTTIALTSDEARLVVVNRERTVSQSFE